MVQSLVRKEGVPALAYSVNDASVLWPCYLKILHSDLQLVVSLEHTITAHDDDKQLLTLRYEGDNLVHGKTSLRTVDIPLPDGSLHDIARHGNPQPRTLSLTLKAPCSVWYPHGLGNGVSSLHTRFHELLTLARATEVHILFDSSWLGKKNLARFQSAIEGSRQLTGVPVIPQFAHLYQQADWSKLNFIQDAKSGAHLPVEYVASEAVPSIEDHDAPPPYARESNKRSRNNRTSLTPDSPLPKRLLQDRTCAPLPKERATSASSSATVQVDIFQDIVKSAVEEVLPDILRTQLPSILQDLLPGMLVGPSPSPSLSPTPCSSQIANALTQHRRSRSHKPAPAAVFRAVISTQTQTHLRRILTDALDRASDQASELHNSAGVEFDEYLADVRLDFATLHEEHIAAFNDDCNEQLEEFKERLVKEKDEVEAHADQVVLKAWDRLNMVKNEEWCPCKCLHSAKDKQSKLEQGCRAMSLPF